MQLKKAKPSQHHLSQFAQKQMSPCHVHHPKLETTVDERIAALIWEAHSWEWQDRKGENSWSQVGQEDKLCTWNPLSFCDHLENN